MATTSSPSSADVIQLLSLEPHPEGGFYRETMRDESSTGPNGRGLSTTIYFLLDSHSVSHLHRMDAAESWHFYAGQPLNIVELGDDGPKVTRLGPGLMQGERPQHFVAANTWFGSRLAEGDGWALVGCTVAPAFLFDHFELGQRPALLEQYPKCKEWIQALTTEE